MLLDSNIIIYSAAEEYKYLRRLFKEENVCCSSISMIEVLGYHTISEEEKLYFENVFLALNILPIDSSIINKAISLRQSKKLSLGDSIIAATAIIRDLEIQTRNTSDFKGFPDIRLNNPIK